MLRIIVLGLCDAEDNLVLGLGDNLVLAMADAIVDAR